ncbi:fructose-1,6-bisphosphatase isozyme 2-like [Thrips palmi]|uniref:fructose-bisphosphatase n=1 Tax=Thrips palmi TaxID=161013 RepID=A0A6P8YS94_THRPL|nr:fructose-1,6-bisphosphatase isozyme 2-like [Thrips palmi]
MSSTSSTSLGRRDREAHREAQRGSRGRHMLGFVMSELRDANNPALDLAELLAAVQAAIKAVSATLRSSGLVKWRSAREVAAEIFVNYVASSHSVAMLICDEKVIPVESSGDNRGRYVVCISPLDSKQDSADPPCIAGSVFSVQRCLEAAPRPQPRTGSATATASSGSSRPNAKPSLRSVLQPGKNLVAAGYALYASSTLLVLSTGPGVHLFALDPVLGEFILTVPNLTIPGRGRIYSVDEGLTYEWGDPVVEYVESKKDPKLGSTYGSHHIGCTVADVHTVMRNGGIYLSPQTRSNPNGKVSFFLFCTLTSLEQSELRLVLEAAPLAHLVCRAGGLATDGHTSLTDCQPEGLAHRTPAFLGSREDVRDLLATFRRNTTLYSTRPSSLRASSAPNTFLDALTPSPSVATTANSQVALLTCGPRTAQNTKDPKKDSKDRAAAAEAEMDASVAALSATIVALGGGSGGSRAVPSRPTSAVYPSSTGSVLGLVPSIQRPASAASALTSSSSGLHRVFS